MAITDVVADLFPLQHRYSGIKFLCLRYSSYSTGKECMVDSTKVARFRALVLPHLDAAFNLACWLTRNPQNAEDVVQEAYLRAFKFFDSLRGEDARSWLLAIVRNTFKTWYHENQEQRQNMVFDEE